MELLFFCAVVICLLRRLKSGGAPSNIYWMPSALLPINHPQRLMDEAMDREWERMAASREWDMAMDQQREWESMIQD
ncbi:hypothetical protein [Pseudoroseomonas sp. WGS1072]|uniref:hypothetical protein n=1 Tax=Roseomonas sp. WGS1072 TaxID=3366816 RepID=UPI003BEFC76D